jgi:hypothetical protein
MIFFSFHASIARFCCSVTVDRSIWAAAGGKPPALVCDQNSAISNHNHSWAPDLWSQFLLPKLSIGETFLPDFRSFTRSSAIPYFAAPIDRDADRFPDDRFWRRLLLDLVSYRGADNDQLMVPIPESCESVQLLRYCVVIACCLL